MKNTLFTLFVILLRITAFGQNTDIRPNTVSYPNLTTAQIDALTPGSDGLRAGTTVYNKDLDCLIIFDGCTWATIDKDNLIDQNKQQELVAPFPQSNSGFGSALELIDNILVVGSRNRDIGANTDQGEAYIYWKNGCTWQLFSTITNLAGSSGDNFGMSVDIKPFEGTSSYRVLIAGKFEARYFILTASSGIPSSIVGTSTIINPNTTPWLHAKFGNQIPDHEIVFTYGNEFKVPYSTSSTYSNCTSANPSANNVEVFRMNGSGVFTSYHTVTASNIVSQALTIPNAGLGRRTFYAQTSCDYWAGLPGTHKSLNRLDWHPTSGYNNFPGTLPESSVLPSLDIHNTGKYSLLAIGNRYGRNRSIKILRISSSGNIDSEENIIESNAYECFSITPSACINGAIPNADFYSETLSISENKLVVGARGSEFSGIGGPGSKGAVYLYKKEGSWYLDKVIEGVAGDAIGNAVAATNNTYSYSQTNFNGGEGKVFIGEW